jgi:hypothetical protein
MSIMSRRHDEFSPPRSARRGAVFETVCDARTPMTMTGSDDDDDGVASRPRLASPRWVGGVRERVVQIDTAPELKRCLAFRPDPVIPSCLSASGTGCWRAGGVDAGRGKQTARTDLGTASTRSVMVSCRGGFPRALLICVPPPEPRPQLRIPLRVLNCASPGESEGYALLNGSMHRRQYSL